MAEIKESYTTTKAHGVRAEILYMRTYDGDSAWRFYPSWQTFNTDAFKAYAKIYTHGVNGSDKDCGRELKMIVEDLAGKLLEEGTEDGAWIAEKCYLLRDAFRPMSMLQETTDGTETFLEKTKDRRYIAYGIYNALAMGYQVDFVTLNADVRKVCDGILAGGDKRAESVLALDRLILDARCMNDVGDVIGWISVLSALIVNYLRAILFTDEQDADLLEHVQKMCKSFESRFLRTKLLYVRNMLGNRFKKLVAEERDHVILHAPNVRVLVDALLKKNRAGEICRRRDDDAIKKAIFTDVPNMFIRLVNGVKCKEKEEALFKQMHALAVDAYKHVEKVIVKGTVEHKEVKKLVAAYEKKGKVPAGWTESFMRQLADEYRAVTLR